MQNLCTESDKENAMVSLNAKKISQI
jgi:hypothetical protein